MELAERLSRVYEALEHSYPEVLPTLDFRNPFELLIGVILSAQTTDGQVNAVIPRLFADYPTPSALAAATQSEIEAIVHSTGFYRVKARHIRETARQIAEAHGSLVPESMEELTALPGVGRKSANVIRGICYGLPAIIVDTHFKRVVARIGLSKAKDPTKMELELARALPADWQLPFSMRANHQGRLVCHARGPDCAECIVRVDCEYGRSRRA